jgi:hypothetical protein
MKFRILISLVVSSLLAGSGWAQTANSTITGLISDASGAVVAEAPVEARNLDTSAVFRAVTTATGNYTLPVPVGPYEMTVTVNGFKQYRRGGLQLVANQVARIDVTLQVGAVSDSVTVTADASLLKTENPALVHNISVTQLQNLPILPVNGGGVSGFATAGLRDPFAMARLIPGVTYAASGSFIVNGNPNNTVNTMIEGQTSNLTRMAGTTTQMVQPSVDAVDQVAILTSNYAAEFGTAGGAVINVTMKSGTNQYHGSLYDYEVNEVLNSGQPYSGTKSRQRRRNPGGTFGGPVVIPHLYDGRGKTFFFFSYERFEEHSVIRSTAATVPLPEYRVGDFRKLITLQGNQMIRVGAQNYVDPQGRSYASGTLFDPASSHPVLCDKVAVPTANCTAGTTYQVRNPLLDNQLNPANFDDVSKKILALVPLPKGANADRGQPSSNYQNPWQNDWTTRLPSIKMDHNVTPSGRLSAYLQSVRYDAPLVFPQGAALGLPQPIDPGRGTSSRNYTGRLNYDFSVTPTLLMHFGVGYLQELIQLQGPVQDYNAETELGLRGAIVHKLFPNITTVNDPTLGGMTTLGVTTGLNSNLSSEYRPSMNFNSTWVRNNHTFKIGWDWRWEFFPNRSLTNTAGNYTLGAASTQQPALADQVVSQGNHGFAFASFLLGNATAININAPSSDRNQKWQTSLFVQDTWKLLPNLTVDYGLRWDFGTYTRELQGRSAIFGSAVANPSAGNHPGGSIFEATCNCKFARNYPYAVGPRAGLAYQITPKTVLRAGFGVVYNAAPIAVGTTFSQASSGQLGAGEWLFQLKDGRPASITPAWPDFRVNAGHANNAVLAAGQQPAAVDQNSGRPARQYQWSAGLQRELSKDLVVEVSYVANRGVWWAAPALSQWNALSQQDLARAGFQLGLASDGTLLNAFVSGALNNTAQRNRLNQLGVGLPYVGYPTNTQRVRDSIRPYPQYAGTLNATGAPLGKTWYDALQLTVTKRLSYGLTLNANYSYGKALNAMDSPDPFNRDLAKNLSPNDIPHQFQFAADYRLPRFRTGILGNRFISAILSEWGMGWYLQYQSAPLIARPASVSQQTPAVPLNNYLGYGPGPAQLKRDADGNYMSPWSVSWTDLSGTKRTDPIDINCHCFDPRTTLVLNRDAWESVPDGKWANDMSDLRFYRGIRLPNESFNLSRTFRVKERIVFTVRAEWQNIFNRLRLPQPAPSGFTSNPNTANGFYTGGFGTLTPTSGNGVSGMRSGTLIGRLTF